MGFLSAIGEWGESIFRGGKNAEKAATEAAVDAETATLRAERLARAEGSAKGSKAWKYAKGAAGVTGGVVVAGATACANMPVICALGTGTLLNTLGINVFGDILGEIQKPLLEGAAGAIAVKMALKAVGVNLPVENLLCAAAPATLAFILNDEKDLVSTALVSGPVFVGGWAGATAIGFFV